MRHRLGNVRISASIAFLLLAAALGIDGQLNLLRLQRIMDLWRPLEDATRWGHAIVYTDVETGKPLVAPLDQVITDEHMVALDWLDQHGGSWCSAVAAHQRSYWTNKGSPTEIALLYELQMRREVIGNRPVLIFICVMTGFVLLVLPAVVRGSNVTPTRLIDDRTPLALQILRGRVLVDGLPRLAFG